MSTTEEVGMSRQKGLSEWWSEETEYVFQRIERWAAFARGYNRLRSQRVSRRRMTMQEEPESHWSISTNKLIIDDCDPSSWSPRFHQLKRTRRRSRPEATKINCCGTFNYQSNSNLDSNCLETYRYDHSIYFKTIGDIRNSKMNIEDRVSISSEEQVEWDIESVSDYLANRRSFQVDDTNDHVKDNCDPSIIVDYRDEDVHRMNSSVWPIVDLSRLDLSFSDVNDAPSNTHDCQNNLMDPPLDYSKEQNNNDFFQHAECIDEKEMQKNQEGIKRFLSFRKNRRLSRHVKQPPIVGENNVIWPGVLLNYTKHFDQSCSTQK